MEPYELAMFPLEHPVVPGQLVPLVLFEPRYLTLAEQLSSESEPSFGVVGIRRGGEVGGGDVRDDVGVVARVVELGSLDEGRRSLVALATRRIRVGEWLDDDPFPRARVTDWPDDLVEGVDMAAAKLASAVHALVETVRRRHPDVEAEVPEIDPERCDASIWQLIMFSALGPLDLGQLLRSSDPVERGKLACRLIDERREMLDALTDDDV